MHISSELASKALSDVNPEFTFWACDGAVLKNIHELADFLEKTNDDVYRYHANQDKNDFSNWINDIVLDNGLAKNIKTAKNKKSAAKIVRQRIGWLHRRAKKIGKK